MKIVYLSNIKMTLRKFYASVKIIGIDCRLFEAPQELQGDKPPGSNFIFYLIK